MSNKLKEKDQVNLVIHFTRIENVLVLTVDQVPDIKERNIVAGGTYTYNFRDKCEFHDTVSIVFDQNEYTKSNLNKGILTINSNDIKRSFVYDYGTKEDAIIYNSLLQMAVESFNVEFGDGEKEPENRFSVHSSYIDIQTIGA